VDRYIRDTGSGAVDTVGYRGIGYLKVPGDYDAGRRGATGFGGTGYDPVN
jgi:hypothetical protein